VSREVSEGVSSALSSIETGVAYTAGFGADFTAETAMALVPDVDAAARSFAGTGAAGTAARWTSVGLGEAVPALVRTRKSPAAIVAASPPM